MTKEKYYAVIIGNPRKDSPYFMVREDIMTPDLFCTRFAAEQAALKRIMKRTYRKVIAVEVCETRRT